MNQALKKISSAGLTDVLGLFGIPTATAGALYAEILEKRKSEALEILFSELRKGSFENVNQHELISVIARYQRDAMEGIAKNNLYLLAQVMSGMADKEELTAPSFYKYADALSSLTKDEIIVLGYMATKKGCSESCKGMLLKRYSEEQRDMILQSLLRTGLIYFYQGVEAEYKTPYWKEAAAGAQPSVKADLYTIYSFTPLMNEILKYVELIIDDQEKKDAGVA